MKKTLYLAANGSGQCCVFVSPPERNGHFRVWEGEMDGLYCSLVSDMEAEGLELPVLKWADEPVVLEVSVEVKQGVVGDERH